MTKTKAKKKQVGKQQKAKKQRIETSSGKARRSYAKQEIKIQEEEIVRKEKRPRRDNLVNMRRRSKKRQLKSRIKREGKERYENYRKDDSISRK